MGDTQGRVDPSYSIHLDTFRQPNPAVTRYVTVKERCVPEGYRMGDTQGRVGPPYPIHLTDDGDDLAGPEDRASSCYASGPPGRMTLFHACCFLL